MNRKGINLYLIEFHKIYEFTFGKSVLRSRSQGHSLNFFNLLNLHGRKYLYLIYRVSEEHDN